MSKTAIIVAEGVFSKVEITLNEDVINKLAVMPKEDNPLANVEVKLKKALKQFEKDYSKAATDV